MNREVKMKKLAITISILSILCSASYAGNAVNEGIKTPAGDAAQQQKCPQKMSKEDMIKLKKAREEAFEKKLGLTEAQKKKAREIRKKGHQQMHPIMEQIKDKKQEAEMIKRSRMAVRMQEEKLAVIDKELASLEKKANAIRKKNMKEFESILTKEQKEILKKMKEEGRQRFEKEHPNRPFPCPEGGRPPEVAK